MYDPQKVEKDVLEFWKKNKIFEKLVEKNKGKKKFRFIDGPITANIPMGVHSAYGRALKDLYQRYKAMQGFDQRFQNGFDCHGLPIEVVVEKELKLKTKKDIEEYGIEKFIQKCKEKVNEISEIQTKQSIRLGQWMDWENTYYTMSDNNITHIWHFLKKCHENSWIYKGYKVIPWCTRCGTSLSQHEVTDGYKELKHKTVFIKFPLVGKEKKSLLVWTTTPWTLTSNVAAAVNPDVVYVKAKKNGEIYYLSKATSDVLEEHKVLEEIKGKDMVGWEYKGPYDELEAQKGVVHKVISWKDVGEEDGTGIVHIAPGCGEEDFELGKELNLKAIAPLDEYGNFIEGFGWLTGKKTKEALDLQLEDLKKKGLLYKIGEISHRYPTCWRCNEELVFRMTDAWFIKVDEIRPRMIREASKVVWSPNFGEKLMNDWLENMIDWNMSRKRYWGLPLPFWECECGELIVVDSFEELKEKAISGMKNLKDLHRPQIDNVILKCPKCSKEVKRIPEVGDCWLDAGIVPFSTLNYLDDKKYWKEWFPAELIAEMKEQIRLWFYSLLFMSVTLEDKTPYEKVLFYDKVYDEKGQEMHKSGENVIWFDDAVEKMGADVMRWTYAKTNLTQNVLFGYSPAKEITKTLDYLVNIAKYINLFLVKPQKDFRKEMEDKWLVSRTESVKKEVYEQIENLNPHIAARILEDFFVNDFSRSYIKFVRSSIKGEDGDKIASLTYYTLLDVLKLMAPFTPFMTESLYQEFFRKFEKKDSIHLCDWPKPNENLIDKKLEKNFEIIRSITEAANSIRQEKCVGLRCPVKKMILCGSDNAIKAVKSLESILKDVSNVKEIEIGKISVKYEIKPNYSILGPKYGKDVKRIVKELEKLDKDKLASELKEKGYIEVLGFKLTDEDLKLIEKAELEGKTFSGEDWNGMVCLDMEETKEIFEESLVRELIRNIQQMRKEHNLVVKQKIKLYLDADDETKEMLEKWENDIKKSVGAKEIIFKKTKPYKACQYKGKKISFGIEVVK